MKPIHFVVGVCFAVSSHFVMAEPAQIKDIRNAYQMAQKNANTADKIVIEKPRTACSDSNLKTEIFLNEQKKPFFIRKTNNNIYTEFLFDNKGEPLFLYNKSKKVEERIYYLNNGTSYTLPTSLSQQNSEYGVEYKKIFNDYKELMIKMNQPVKDLSDKEIKNLETRMINVEQAKNNPQIKQIGKEINFKTTGWHTLKITEYPKNKTKTQWQFYYSDNGKCGEENNEQLQFVKISDYFDDNVDILSDETFKFHQKKEQLQHYTFSESIEGSFSEIYFLPNNQVYCVGDLRVMLDNGSFDYKPAACHQRDPNSPFFGPNYNAENQAQQLRNIFWQVMKIEYGL